MTRSEYFSLYGVCLNAARMIHMDIPRESKYWRFVFENYTYKVGAYGTGIGLVRHPYKTSAIIPIKSLTPEDLLVAINLFAINDVLAS